MANGILTCNAHRQQACGASAGSDILDPNGHGISAMKLAVDCQIERGKVASALASIWSCPDRPDVLGRTGGFHLFHGTRLS
jgi:hypothetical protein